MRIYSPEIGIQQYIGGQHCISGRASDLDEDVTGKFLERRKGKNLVHERKYCGFNTMFRTDAYLIEGEF